jgi:hypothetical protein
MSEILPDALEEYRFDLEGYTVIHGAIEAEHLAAMNHWIDQLPQVNLGEALGNVAVHTYGSQDGLNLQNIIEGGEIFERLVDHPAWIRRVKHYLGTRHRPYVSESFLNVRKEAGYIGAHSGGHIVDSRKRSGRDRGQWCCSYLTLLLALTDVGPGDGATAVVPGSHKSDLPHPRQEPGGGLSSASGEDLEGAEECFLKAGDALLLNDFALHASTRRRNSGERRMIIFRYVPEIYAHRWGYVPSAELLKRITDSQRAIILPNTPGVPAIKV